mgnify:CR=1 FL=1
MPDKPNDSNNRDDCSRSHALTGSTREAERSIIRYQRFLLRRQTELLTEAHRRDAVMLRRLKRLERENKRLKKLGPIDYFSAMIMG